MQWHVLAKIVHTRKTSNPFGFFPRQLLYIVRTHCETYCLLRDAPAQKGAF